VGCVPHTLAFRHFTRWSSVIVLRHFYYAVKTVLDSVSLSSFFL
jgi:hypothetical protein